MLALKFDISTCQHLLSSSGTFPARSLGLGESTYHREYLFTFAFVLFNFLFYISASDMRGYTVLFPALLLIYCRILLGASCYWPNQAILDKPYLPCSGMASDVHSACCASGDQCTENGYCFGSAGYVYRGGCTDITWQSPNCAQECRESTLYQPQEDQLLPKKILLML